MKKTVFFVLLITLFIPGLVSARTAIDSYGNEYEVYDEVPSDFNEDNIEDEYGKSGFSTTSTTQVVTTTISANKEKREQKKNNSKLISYGIIAITAIVILIGALLFFLKATQASRLY